MSRIGNYTQPFEPNWASKPWNTIRDIIQEREWSLDEFIEKMGIDWNIFGALYGGSLVIDEPLAQKLKTVLGASVQFWIDRDLQYRASLERIANLNK